MGSAGFSFSSFAFWRRDASIVFFFGVETSHVFGFFEIRMDGLWGFGGLLMSVGRSFAFSACLELCFLEIFH